MFQLVLFDDFHSMLLQDFRKSFSIPFIESQNVQGVGATAPPAS